jgi:iron complex outermembrane recepter protein
MLANRIPKSALLCVTAMLALLSLPANAQNADEDQANSSADSEIIVTANRRQQAIQDVSSSLSALSEEALKKKGYDGLDDLAATVPGLTINSGIRNRSTPNIRGLALNTGGGNTQEPVAIYINDAPVVAQYSAAVVPDLRLYDVERVEVLRGPQGTLFGSGSLGGTIRIITNKPDASRFAASGRVDLGVTKGGAFRQRYDAMVNVPIANDKLALRAVGYYRNEEGWVENVNPASLGLKNDAVEYGGRVSLQFTPSDQFTLRAEALYQNSKPRDGDSWDPALGKFKRSSLVPEPRKSVFSVYSLTGEYEFDNFATLSVISTYLDSKTRFTADRGDLFGIGNLINDFDPFRSKQFSQELRLVSNSGGALEWVAGAFYLRSRGNTNFLFFIPGVDNLLFGGALGSDVFLESVNKTRNQELAGYADLTYSLTDRLKINGGIRVFQTKASYLEPSRRTLNFDTSNYDISIVSNQSKGTDFTWRTGLSYNWDTTLLYANVSKGFRVGQVNPNSGPSIADPNDVVIPAGYGPDSTINYEIGLKNTWLDGRVTANIAAYYIDWKNIQLEGSRISDNLNFIANAGSATSKGIEIDISVEPTDGLNIFTAVAFQDAKITSVAPNIILPAAKGDILPGLVDLKISGGAEYSWSVGKSSEMFARADAAFVGNSPSDLANGGPVVKNQPYFNMDASIGLNTKWGSISLYGENLTNNDSFILQSNIPDTLNPVNTLRPRTFGFRAEAKF